MEDFAASEDFSTSPAVTRHECAHEFGFGWIVLAVLAGAVVSVVCLVGVQ